jgi:hypothetical protein
MCSKEIGQRQEVGCPSLPKQSQKSKVHLSEISLLKGEMSIWRKVWVFTYFSTVRRCPSNVKGSFFFARAQQQMLRTHRSLEAYCATLVMKIKRQVISFFLFFQVMEHQWNEIDRGKPKYSGKNLFHCHFVHHILSLHWLRIQITKLFFHLFFPIFYFTLPSHPLQKYDLFLRSSHIFAFISNTLQDRVSPRKCYTKWLELYEYDMYKTFVGFMFMDNSNNE